MIDVYVRIWPSALSLSDGKEGYPIEPQLEKLIQWRSLCIKAFIVWNKLLDPH